MVMRDRNRCELIDRMMELASVLDALVAARSDASCHMLA